MFCDDGLSKSMDDGEQQKITIISNEDITLCEGVKYSAIVNRQNVRLI